jgi:hypothetical protein
MRNLLHVLPSLAHEFISFSFENSPDRVCASLHGEIYMGTLCQGQC